MNNTNTEIKPDIRIVKLDETGFWMDEWLVSHAGKIFGVYMYDASKQTHCCEVTPSYELHFIESQPLAYQEDEAIREKMDEHLRDGDIETDPIRYTHVRDIERIAEVVEGKFPEHSHRFKLSHLEGYEWGDEDTTAIDEAMEWVRGNSV